VGAVGSEASSIRACSPATTNLALVLAALIGAMTWNLITWYFTIPSSSGHALIGATIAASSASAVNGQNLVESVIVPAIQSPIICGVAALTAMLIAYRLIRRLGRIEAISGYRLGQIGSEMEAERLDVVAEPAVA